MKHFLGGNPKGVLFLFSVLLFSSCTPDGGSPETADGKEKKGDRIVTARPKRRRLVRTAKWFGRVEAARRVRVRALSDGRILEVKVRDGAEVAAGDPLFLLGGPTAEAQMRRLEARAEAAREAASLAEKVFNSEESALKSRMGTVREKNAAFAEWRRKEAEAEAAERELEFLRARLALKAPLKGIFTQRRVNAGEDVRAGDVLADIIDPGSLWIEAEAFLGDDRGLLGPGIEARVEGESGRKPKVEVLLVHPTAAPSGATRFRLSAPKTLSPGEKVGGELLIEIRSQVLSVPAAAVVRGEGEVPYVFVRKKDGYEKRRVVPGLETEKYVEIRSGVSAEDEVVIEGALGLLHRDFRRIYREED